MSTTKHTPGPWQVVAAMNRGMAICTPVNVYDATDERVASVSDYATDEALANARLMADAPALLDALAEVIRYDDLTHPCDHAPDPESCTHCRARALVAKHKGPSHG